MGQSHSGALPRECGSKGELGFGPFSRWPGVTWAYLTPVAGLAETALPLSQESLSPPLVDLERGHFSSKSLSGSVPTSLSPPNHVVPKSPFVPKLVPCDTASV